MTTTLMKNSVLEIQQPPQKDQDPEIKAERVLNLVLGKNNEVYWYMGMPGSEVSRTDFSNTGVRKLLLEKNQQVKGMFVLIKASDHSRYQNTVDMLDELTITRITRYSMVNLDREDERLVR